MSGASRGPTTSESAPPMLLIKGNATAEETAALVAVIAGLSAASAAAAAATKPLRAGSQWSSPARQVRTPHHAQLGGWRASALPR